MRIAAARAFPYRLPLKRPWVASSATLTERRGMLVAVTDADGVTGWGDCAPLPSSGAAGHERVFAALAAAAASAEGWNGDDALRSLDDVPVAEVRWALETALRDLEARRAAIPLARLLGGAGTSVAVNAALGPLDAGCAARAFDALARGYDVAKLKVGVADLDAELDHLRAVSSATGHRLRLRLDANRAWREADARRFLTAIADLPIDGVEEPLADPTPARLGELQRALPFAVAVDESLPSFGIAAVLASGVRRLVVKPARIGGMAATLDLAAQAAEAGMEIVLTSLVDSVVGVAAAAHLAAALPGPALAHGLATGEWLAADLGPALPIIDGRLDLGTAPGLGFVPVPPEPGAAA